MVVFSRLSRDYPHSNFGFPQEECRYWFPDIVCSFFFVVNFTGL
jgi:hypothetical protein